MLIRYNNSAPKSPMDLDMNNLGELSSKFINYLRKDKLIFMPPGPGVYMIGRGLSKSEATKKYKEELESKLKSLIESGELTLDELRSRYGAWLRRNAEERNKPKDFDKIIKKLKSGDKVLPFIRIDNHWTYLMGKIGGTSAGFTKLKKSKNPDRIVYTPYGGWELLGYEWSDPKPISELPEIEVLIAGEFPDGEQFKVMNLPDIREYLSNYDDQTFYAYK